MSDVKPVAWKYREPVTRIATFRTKQSGALLSLAYIEEPLYSQATITALQAEIEALRKDVERYRWLRSRMPGAAYRVEGIIYSQGGSGVDAGVDAAIAKEKQP